MVKVKLESVLVHQVIDLLQLVSQFAPAQNCKSSKGVVKKLKTATSSDAEVAALQKLSNLKKKSACIRVLYM